MGQRAGTAPGTAVSVHQDQDEGNEQQTRISELRAARQTYLPRLIGRTYTSVAAPPGRYVCFLGVHVEDSAAILVPRSFSCIGDRIIGVGSIRRPVDRDVMDSLDASVTQRVERGAGPGHGRGTMIVSWNKACAAA